MSELMRIYHDPPNTKAINKVISLFKNGGIVIFPSDTVYAMGCVASNKKAVERMRTIHRGKIANTPMSFICRDLSQVSTLTKQLDQPVFKILKRAFPGPYTFILPGGSHLPSSFKKRKEVGVRIPNNEIVRSILDGLGEPIATRSIKDENLMLEYITDPELVYEHWQHQVDLVIDGGISGNIASTVIDLTVYPPEVIREGLGSIDFI